jgi:predicted dehydrogenase
MIRVAIIGLGAVTRNLHLPAYSRLKDELAVVGGCDPDCAAAKLASEKWHLRELFESPQEMLEKTRPDVVSVCSPPALHREHCLLALERGCHVFCEKPFAENLQQADEILQASRRAGRLVVVNNQFPYMNIYQASKQMIGTAAFGRLLYLHAWQTFRPTDLTEASWRGKLQRRLCFEFGVHVFELVRFFFEDTPARIWAHMPRPNSEIQADLINVVSLEFSDGRAASLVLDRLSKGPEHYLDMRLDGEFASIHTSIGGQVRFEAGVHTKERRPFVGFRFVQGGKAVLQNGNRSKLLAKDGLNPFASATAHHFRNFLRAVREGGTPPGVASDNRKTLAMVMAAYDSADAGRAVELKPYLDPRVPA